MQELLLLRVCWRFWYFQGTTDHGLFGASDILGNLQTPNEISTVKGNLIESNRPSFMTRTSEKKNRNGNEVACIYVAMRKESVALLLYQSRFLTLVQLKAQG